MTDLKLNYNFEQEIPNFKKKLEQGNIFIPKELMRYKKLKTNEKIYLAAYLNYDNNIEKANDYVKQMISNTSVCNIRKKLIKLGYIQIPQSKNPIEAKQLTIENSHKGSICEWCKNECYVLQEHHYPIPKRLGGKNIVKICPNCHYTFHKIFDNNNYHKEEK